jgi:hypothetical protein
MSRPLAQASQEQKILEDGVVAFVCIEADGAGTKPENTKHQDNTKTGEILDIFPHALQDKDVEHSVGFLERFRKFQDV